MSSVHDSLSVSSELLSRIISRRAWTTNPDGTLTLELMAVNPASYCRTSEVAITSRSPCARHSHAWWASGERTDSQELRASPGIRRRLALNVESLSRVSKTLEDGHE